MVKVLGLEMSSEYSERSKVREESIEHSTTSEVSEKKNEIGLGRSHS